MCGKSNGTRRRMPGVFHPMFLRKSGISFIPLMRHTIMQTFRLALIGFGNVGQGFAQILAERGDALALRYGAQIQIVAVSDLLKGAVYDPNGLDPRALLDTVRATGKVDTVNAPHHGWDAQKTILETNANVVVELAYTDLKTGEPAFTHLKLALENNQHVITTNKGPIALHYAALKQIADTHGVTIGAEGTVMSGTPTLRLGMEMLAAANITRVMGILNGTTNYILTQMENGATYADALQDAQARGYAEADPTGDVEGFDAAGKVVILSNLLMQTPLAMNDIDRTGITQLTPQDIADARANGERWKLIGKLEKENGQWRASVRPTRLPLTHPLASVMNATNAITFSTDLLGDVTLVGAGAGRMETGYAILEDVLALHRSTR